MLALISSALSGLAAIRDLVELIVKGNVLARLAEIEKKQESTSRAFNALASANTREERANAIALIGDNWNSK
jgi:hypothetical protein